MENKMYQLIIYYDSGETKVAAEGTLTEIYEAMPAVAITINPDEALWEVKELKNGHVEVKDEELFSLPGIFKNDLFRENG